MQHWHIFQQSLKENDPEIFHLHQFFEGLQKQNPWGSAHWSSQYQVGSPCRDLGGISPLIYNSSMWFLKRASAMNSAPGEVQLLEPCQSISNYWCLFSYRLISNYNNTILWRKPHVVTKKLCRLPCVYQTFKTLWYYGNLYATLQKRCLGVVVLLW